MKMIQNDLPEKFDVPAKFRDFPLSSFSLSVRLTNVLASLNFKTLGELDGMSVEQFKSTRHCGVKTVHEMVSIVESVRNIESGEDLVASGSVVAAPSDLTLNQFIDLIDKFVGEQKPLRHKILMGRYGGEIDQTKTLEELGGENDLSRERIRQITSSAMNKLKKILGEAGEKLYARIYEDCAETLAPLTPGLLLLRSGRAAESDFRFRLSFYIRIIEEFAPQIPAIPANGLYHRRPVEPREVAVYRGIRSNLGHRHKEIVLRDVWDKLLASDDVKDLRAEEFLKACRYDKDFSLNLNDPEKPLIYLTAKPKIHEIAHAVLSESDVPLRPDHIIERAKILFGEDDLSISIPGLLHLTTLKEDFYLLDRRRIGLRKHLTFPQEEWGTVRNDIYKLLKKRKRSYSTRELVSGDLFPWSSRINPSELAQIMREDLRFTDLGRLNFGLKEWGIRKRRKIADLVIEALRSADHPLHPLEIKEEVQKHRTVHEAGLSTIIRQHKDVKEYGYSFYGLKEWGDDKLEYLLNNATFIYRFLIMSETPLRFGDMCKRLGIEKNQMLVKILWERLKTMPKTELRPNQKSPNTLILYNSYGKVRYRKKHFPELEKD